MISLLYCDDHVVINMVSILLCVIQDYLGYCDNIIMIDIYVSPLFLLLMFMLIFIKDVSVVDFAVVFSSLWFFVVFFPSIFSSTSSFPFFFFCFG